MNAREKKAQRAAAAWTHPVGTAVEVLLDSGERRRTTTRSEPSVVGQTAVIWLVRISGCYALERVQAVDHDPTSCELECCTTPVPYDLTETAIRVSCEVDT